MYNRHREPLNSDAEHILNKAISSHTALTKTRPLQFTLKFGPRGNL